MNRTTGHELLAELTRDLEVYAESQGMSHPYLVGRFHGIIRNIVHHPVVQQELLMQLAGVREDLRSLATSTTNL